MKNYFAAATTRLKTRGTCVPAGGEGREGDRDKRRKRIGEARAEISLCAHANDVGHRDAYIVTRN